MHGWCTEPLYTLCYDATHSSPAPVPERRSAIVFIRTNKVWGIPYEQNLFRSACYTLYAHSYTHMRICASLLCCPLDFCVFVLFVVPFLKGPNIIISLGCWRCSLKQWQTYVVVWLAKVQLGIHPYHAVVVWGRCVCVVVLLPAWGSEIPVCQCGEPWPCTTDQEARNAFVQQAQTTANNNTNNRNNNNDEKWHQHCGFLCSLMTNTVWADGVHVLHYVGKYV